MDKETTAAADTLIITLTNHPPVKIKEDNWPVIASADDDGYDGQVYEQSNRMWERGITVRQHADGRTLVYGVYDFETHFQKEKSVRVCGGKLITVQRADAEHIGDFGPIIDAIREVGEWMVSNTGEAMFQRLINECIGNLPVLELDAE